MLKLPRIQLFEFCDQAWLPETFRTYFHVSLSFSERVFGIFNEAPRIVNNFMSKTGNSILLDLCSGHGGMVDNLVCVARKKQIKLPKIVLSDIFPNLRGYSILQMKHGENSLSYLDKPLSVHELNGTPHKSLMMVFALHHFGPAAATEIIRNMAREKKNILILEGMERSFLTLLLFVLTFPVAVLSFALCGIFVRPASIIGLVFSILIPIIPLMVFFDGVVSILRIYTFKEIEAMLPPEEKENYSIEYSSFKTNSILDGYYFQFVYKSGE